MTRHTSLRRSISSGFTAAHVLRTLASWCSLAALLLVSTRLVADVEPVSPGGQTEWIEINSRCPTFNWTRAEGTEVELVIYQLAEESAEQKPREVLRVELPGSAQGWTPSSEECLAPGERYAWSTRSGSDSHQDEWSRPFLFEIAGSPSTEELRDALRTIRRHISETHELGSGAPEEAFGPAASPSPVRPRPFESRFLKSQTTGAGGSNGLDVHVDAGYGVVSYSDSGSAMRAVGRNGLVAIGEGALGSGAFLFGTNGANGLTISSSSCCDGNISTNHAADIGNSSGSGSGGDVLALTSNTAVPGAATNFVSFFGGNSVIGQIQGDGVGGVEFDGTLSSPSADLAEFLPKLDEADVLEPASVVGLLGGKLSHRTRGADRVMVVSTRPMVTGGRPDPGEEARFARVAFLGRVPVRVQGRVIAGDFLVPSGLEDGTAVAVSARDLHLLDNRLVVGRALEDSSATSKEGGVTVEALVGLAQPSFPPEWRAALLEARIYRWLCVALIVVGFARLAARRVRADSSMSPRVA